MKKKGCKFSILILIMCLLISNSGIQNVVAAQPEIIVEDKVIQTEAGMVETEEVDGEVNETDSETAQYAGQVVSQEIEDGDVKERTPKGANDIKLLFDGEVRGEYRNIVINDTNEVTVSANGEVIEAVNWSSEDPDIAIISGNKDGAVLEAKSIGNRADFE